MRSTMQVCTVYASQECLAVQGCTDTLTDHSHQSSRPHPRTPCPAYDYYGKRLATCSSDRGIKVFEIEGEQVLGRGRVSGFWAR